MSVSRSWLPYGDKANPRASSPESPHPIQRPASQALLQWDSFSPWPANFGACSLWLAPPPTRDLPSLGWKLLGFYCLWLYHPELRKTEPAPKGLGHFGECNILRSTPPEVTPPRGYSQPVLTTGALIHGCYPSMLARWDLASCTFHSRGCDPWAFFPMTNLPVLSKSVALSFQGFHDGIEHHWNCFLGLCLLPILLWGLATSGDSSSVMPPCFHPPRLFPLGL